MQCFMSINFNTNLDNAPTAEELLLDVVEHKPNGRGVAIGYFFTDYKGKLVATVKGLGNSDRGTFEVVGWKKLEDYAK